MNPRMVRVGGPTPVFMGSPCFNMKCGQVFDDSAHGVLLCAPACRRFMGRTKGMKCLSSWALLLVVSTSAMAADDPFVGSYRLQVDKSTSSGLPLPVAATLVLSEDGDNLVFTVSQKNADGSSLDEATSMPKGGCALRRIGGGTLRYDSVTTTRPNSTTIEMAMMRDGQEAMRHKYELSADHQVLTLTRTAGETNASGQRVGAVFVLERQ